MTPAWAAARAHRRVQGRGGLQTSQRKFSAEGEEAYVQPPSPARWVFVLEEYRLGDWRFEGALRHDRQTAEAQTSGIERSHNGTSASLGAVWRFTPGYQVGASFTRASRAPSAEELYAGACTWLPARTSGAMLICGRRPRKTST